MKAVFLDRDGTLNVEMPYYLTHHEHLLVLDPSYEAVRLLKANQFKTIVVTNQSCVTKGLISEEELHRVHKRLETRLSAQKAHLDAVYYCPHNPDDGCTCRKPKTGLLEKAVKEHGVNLSESFFVGDRMFDIRAGKNAGCKTILVLTGEGRQTLKKIKSEHPNEAPDFVANHVLDAAQWIVSQ